MKTNEMIAGLRKLCGQGTEYRRTVCRLAADTLEAQQKRIEELEAELKDERHRHDRYVDFELAQAKELEQMRAERRWIPVTERLPEHSDGHVLVTDGEQVKISCRNACYQTANGEIRCAQGYGSGMPVTHWMPMPEAAKEGS